VRISAKKIAGVKVPLAAVGHRYERPDLLELWYGFVDALGCWHQMQNDVLGWSRDLAHGRKTYFLSEASARKGDDASIAQWVISDGVGWARDELDVWMRQLRERARELNCPPLSAYVERRRATLAREWDELARSLAMLDQAAAALR
jgi:hypothetical protein